MDSRSAGCEVSGLGHREWCRMSNIRYSTFKYRASVELGTARINLSVCATLEQMKTVLAEMYDRN